MAVSRAAALCWRSGCRSRVPRSGAVRARLLCTSAESRKGQRAVLIDASALLFRSYHAYPVLTRPADGEPVHALYGFTKALLSLFLDNSAYYGTTHCAVCFDAPRARQERRALYSAYKHGRSGAPPDLVRQIALARELVTACGMRAFLDETHEADDLLASLASLAADSSLPTVIVSPDKDLLQCVRDDANVVVYDPVKRRELREADVRARFGVGPELVPDVQALAGDASDGIPGVRGVGLKIAAELVQRFGSAKAAVHGAAEVVQPARRAALERAAGEVPLWLHLTTLRTACSPVKRIDEIAWHGVHAERLVPFLEEQGFASILATIKRFSS